MILSSAFISTSPGFLLAGGGEAALIATMVFTALCVGVVLLYMLMPDSARDSMEQSLSRLQRYVIRGSQEEGADLNHDYDGIRELDNGIPPWFMYLFYGTIIFAGVYMLDYHVFGTSSLSGAEYQAELAAADVQRRLLIASEGQIDENTLVALNDEEAIKRGSENYRKNCISCHGANGQGIVGPNLTDHYWIHGGGVKNIYAVIKNGVPAKGMISWQLVFTPKQTQEIASYVLTFQGTNPAGGKAPQGDLWVEKDTAVVAAADSAGATR